MCWKVCWASKGVWLYRNIKDEADIEREKAKEKLELKTIN